MSNAEIAFAVIVGGISALGVVLSAVLTAYSTDKAAKLAARGVDRQVMLNSAVKIAEFRQNWINDLRREMVSFLGLGLRLEPTSIREIYEAGIKVELLMNRSDPRYQRLRECMSDYIGAETKKEKSDCAHPFVEICQDILKNEWEVLKEELRKITHQVTG